MWIKYCIVPNCHSSSDKTPNKQFFMLPLDPEKRKKWMAAMNRTEPLSPKTQARCCQDHFDIKKDFQKYMTYRLYGGVPRLRASVIPHKFACQEKSKTQEETVLKTKSKIDNNPSVLSENNSSISHDIQGIDIKATPVGDVSMESKVKRYILSQYCNVNMESQETETAAGVNNANLEKEIIVKSHAQRQKEYRKRKKIQNQLLNVKKIPKTNAQCQQEFRQKKKEKLQQNETLNLARKKNDAVRAKRYRDKLKLKKQCAALDSVLSSKEDSLPTVFIESYKETNHRHDTNCEELIYNQFQINERDECSTPNTSHHEIDNARNDMGKSRAEYMRNYRQKKREKKLKTGGVQPKKIARNSTQRSRDFRARAASTILAETSTADPTNALVVSHATLRLSSLPLPSTPSTSTASVSNTGPAEIHPHLTDAEQERVVRGDVEQVEHVANNSTVSSVPTPSANKSKELEKFKRRMIREVARLMLKDKVPEEQMWEELKKKTGCDCELLWVRMRSITLKKLRRLLVAEDRMDDVPKAARMTITDWLLFDLVLVHEKTDFINMDGPRMKKGELKPLTDLFSLVQKYSIEGLTSGSLAEAWTEATLYYNSQGHHVSPMLLQKRWYQLKESTRDCFYKFWFSYRGNAKQFLKASAQHMPTMLQIAIARRFKEVVISPFIEWDEMIAKDLIILAEEFDARLRTNKKQIDENAPDIELLEPVIETIDLGADSDTETNKNDDNTEKKETSPVKTIVKTEPEDDIEIDEDFMKANADLIQNTLIQQGDDTFDKEYDDMDADFDDDTENTDLLEHETPSLMGNDDSRLPNCDDDNKTSTPNDIINSNSNYSINSHNAENMSTPVHTNDNIASKEIENVKEKSSLLNSEFTEPTEEVQTLPQITGVFGNTDITKNALTKISALKKEIIDVIDDSKSNQDDGDVITMSDEPKLPVVRGAKITNLEEIPTVPVGATSCIKQKVKTIHTDDIINRTCEEALEKLKVEMVDGKIKSSSAFGELPTYLNLSDNGIELVDDGIAYVDEDMEISNDMVKIDTEDAQSEEEESDEQAEYKQETPEESAKIDLKLLLYPVVYTTKLDHMGIFDEPSETVTGSDLIDTIYLKSKPISKRTINLKDIKNENESNDLNRNLSDDEESLDDIITNESRVNFTSYLLQKPRTRNYNPVVLCKNPDFNTRLKRLTVGFFSSFRNRMLLKHCKPLTVDLSKAFESKMINGTIYLKTSEAETQSFKEAPNIETPQQVSVVPSAMPVQSLIDNNKVTPDSTAALIPKSSDGIVHDDLLIVERSKSINLPDISQVRRVNQRLLTAEVSPIQLQNPMTTIASTSSTFKSEVCSINATSVTKPKEVELNSGTASNAVEGSTLQRHEVLRKSESQTAATTSTVNSTNTRTRDYKKKQNPCPWKPKQKCTVSWLVGKPVNYGSDDVLLTMDTLNKMLCLLTQEKEERDKIIEKPARQLTKKCNKEMQKRERPKKKSEVTKQSDKGTQMSTENDALNDDVQIISDTTEEKQPQSKPIRKPKMRIISGNQQGNCCWVRRKIEAKKLRKRITFIHQCPQWECYCCCKNELSSLSQKRTALVNTPKGLEQTCETIESVVQQTYSDDKGNEDDSPVVIEDREPDNILTPSTPNDVTSQKCQKISEDSTGLECPNNKNETTAPISIDNIDTEDTPSIGAEVSVGEMSPQPIVLDSTEFESKRVQFATPHVPFKVTNTIPKLHRVMTHYVPAKRAPRALIPDGRRNPESIVCKCVPKLSVAPESAQRKIIIDGTSACPLHGLKLPKLDSNDKQIFLTSKQISQKPTRSPIFLGKNQILLTNVKFPCDFSPTQSVQQAPVVKIIPTLPLPTGIQLVLMPNGELTYTVDPNIEIDPQKLASLPQILEAVRQQLNSTQSVRPANNLASDEILTLSDDETAEPNEDVEQSQSLTSNITDDKGTINVENKDAPMMVTEEINDNITHIAQLAKPLEEQNTEEHSDSSTYSPINQTPNESCVNVATPTVNIKQQVLGECNEYNNENNDETVSTVHKESNKVSNDQPTTDEVALSNNVSDSQNIPTNTETDTRTVNKESSSEGAGLVLNKDSTVSNTLNPPTKETEQNIIQKDTIKSKNILSDLMEMSGISADDVTPAPAEPPPQEVASETFVQSALKKFLQPECISSPVIASCKINPNALENFNEFSTITSLAELKYARAHNGSFYKLDFETGAIVPINVCIEKQPSRQPPTGLPSTLAKSATIDLTDEDVPQDTNIAPNAINNPSLLIANHIKKAANVFRTKARPLKLFRSVHPAILQTLKQSKKNVNISIVKTFTQYKQTTRQRGRPRKQVLDKVEATIDMVDSDCPMEEEYLDSSGSEPETSKRKVESDDSSDEEPLSNVAKKMRIAEAHKDNESFKKARTEESIDSGAEESVNNNINEEVAEPENFSFMIDPSDEEGEADCILGV